MQYKITIEPTLQVISVTLEGRITIDGAAHLSNESIKLARNHRCNHLLLDCSAADISTKSIDIFISSINQPQAGILLITKIATVILPDDDKKNYLNATIELSKPGALRFFYDTQSAVNWLTTS